VPRPRTPARGFCDNIVSYVVGDWAMVGHMRTRNDWPGITERTRRQIEKLRNLNALIAIRDGPGGSPAADTARLQAARRLSPKLVRVGLRKAAAAAGKLRAGYVIMLPATDPPIESK
jgi:hypothetical protein